MRRFVLPVVLLIGFLSIFLIQLQFFSGLYFTPVGTKYLGTVHFHADYFTYLSFVAQGDAPVGASWGRWINSKILFTEEDIPEMFIRWPFVLAGRIGSLVGLDSIWSYQLAVVVGLVCFLGAAWWVISLVSKGGDKGEKGDLEKRVLAFLFFATSTSWPWIEMTKEGWNISYYQYWYNVGNIFGRLGPTPNNLMVGALSLAGIGLVMKWWTSRASVLLGVGIVVSGALISSISPVPWMICVVALGMAGVVGNLRYLGDLSNLGKIIKSFIPVVLLGLGGLPVYFYIDTMFSGPLTSGVVAWEATQQIYPSIKEIFYRNGVVIVFAVVGVIGYLRHLGNLGKNKGALVCLSFVVVCAGFFFSSIPARLNLTNVRFWPPFLYVFLSILAVEGIWGMCGLWRRWGKRAILWVCILLYVVTTVPSIWGQEREIYKPDKNNVLIYLPGEIYEMYQYVKATMPRDALYLVQVPWNEPFPGITGRRVFHHTFTIATIDGEKKSAEANAFFSGGYSVADAEGFLRRHNIEYVLGYTGNVTLEGFVFLEKIYTKGPVTLYKVKL